MLMRFFWLVLKQERVRYHCKRLSLPIILGSAKGDVLDQDYLSSRNVRICLKGHQPSLPLYKQPTLHLKPFVRECLSKI